MKNFTSGNIMSIMTILCVTALLVIGKISEDIYYNIVVALISFKIGKRTAIKKDNFDLKFPIDIISRRRMKK